MIVLTLAEIIKKIGRVLNINNYLINACGVNILQTRCYNPFLKNMSKYNTGLQTHSQTEALLLPFRTIQ